MSRKRVSAEGATNTNGAAVEGLWPAHLSRNRTTPHNHPHAPSRAKLRCPSCGATIPRFSSLTGRYGDSLARCPRTYCRQQAPRWAWRTAA